MNGETVGKDAISHRKLWTALVYRTSLTAFVNLKSFHTHIPNKVKLQTCSLPNRDMF